MARTSCGCGRCRSTSPRTTASARRSSPASPTSIASCATPSAICSARSTGSATTSGWTTFAAYPELERYMLHLTAELDQKLRNAVDDFDFNTYVRALTDFCNEDCRAFYFDIRKDVPLLRGEPRDGFPDGASPRLPDRARHAVPRAGALAGARARLHDRGSMGDALSRTPGRCTCWSGPRCRPVHANDAKWSALRELRTQVTEAIEPLRRDKVIGSSLEAEVTRARASPRRRRNWPSCSSSRQFTKAMSSR